jgi:tetratricopeptide (TPR) repeat protein
MSRNKAIIAIAAIVGLLPGMQLAAQTLPGPPRTPAHAPTPARDPLQGAEALLQAGQFAQAEEKLKGLTESQTKNPQFWFDLGFAQSHQSKTQDAVVAYQKAVELAPEWFEANLNLGLDLLKSGNSAAAVPVLKHTVELKPSSGAEKALGNAWLSLAKALEAGETDLIGAAAAYDKAAQMNPGDVGLSVRAGNLLQRAGDLDGAERHYTKAALAGDAGGMAQLIDLLNQHKRYADAELWLRKYLKQNPADTAAIVLLGQTLIAEGRGEEAIAMLRPLSTPTTFAINQQLADLYIDDKKYAAAIPILQQLVEKDPSDPHLHFRLGVALLHQLKYAEAETELLKTLQLKPDLAEGYAYLAEAARQNQHFELCIRALDMRLRFLPETPATYFLRATAYDSLKMYKPAAENYKLFLAAAAGKFPDQEFQARHRLIAIAPK